MTCWTFTGRILPERIPLSVSMVEQTSEIPDIGLRYRTKIKIDKGHFIIPAVIESGQTDVLTLRNIVENDLRAITDLVGYHEGSSFDIDMVSAVSDEGPAVIFGNQIPILQQTRQARTGELTEELKVVCEETSARLVLADFREAMRDPVGTGFFCYRAIEAMMQTMKAHPDDKDAPAWDLLRTRLQLDRSTLDTIKPHADYPRHGKPSSITDADRAKVFLITDEIVRRYLTYLRGGKVALKSSDFPVF
jgi:hypothetical protein